MANYQIIETNNKFNCDEIATFCSVKNFDANIPLDRKRPIKMNPFITFYCVENIYNTWEFLSDENNKIIILLKEDIEDIYINDDEEGYVLSNDMIVYPYLCNDKEFFEISNKIGTLVLKECYFDNDCFSRRIRLKDNVMEIYSQYVFNVDIYLGKILENDEHLQVNYDDVSYDVEKYIKVYLNDLDEIIFDMIVSKGVYNYKILSKDELCTYIEELIKILQEKYGKIKNIFMVDEKNTKYDLGKISGLYDGVTLFIETMEYIGIISSGVAA